VRFVDDEKETSHKHSRLPSYRSNKTRLSSSSSSSSSDSDEDDEDLDSIYRQYDIHGNRIKRPTNFGTKISYVDEHGHGNCVEFVGYATDFGRDIGYITSFES
ncbi:unnamed protein product, partial [Adineta steineri]